MKPYRMPARKGQSEETVKRSVFLGSAFPVKDEEEALSLIAKEKKRYPDARHCAWAYVLGEAGDRLRYSDDGEPQGTAGVPILNVIRARDMTDTLVCVTRYFGGVLLGTGGLTRAYSSAATKALDEAGCAAMTPAIRAGITIEYPSLSRLQGFLEKDDCVRVESTDYALAVTVTVLVQSAAWDAFCTKLTDLFNGTVTPQKHETFYTAWETKKG